jgi:hypothetical protein
MKNTFISENNFKKQVTQIYWEETLSILDEKWSKFDKVDKLLVLETLKTIYPEKSNLINESKWYNTLGDIAGIFDPTGVIDLLNGFSYWKQDEKFYAILSWISVIPGLGDLIAKPVVGLMKMGGESVRLFKAATVANDAVKLGKAAKEAGGPIKEFVRTSPTWGSKLLDIMRASAGKIPYIGPRFLRLLEEYVELFTKGSKEMGASEKLFAKTAGKALSEVEKETLLKQLAKEAEFKGFTNYGTGKNSWLSFWKSDASAWKKINAGFPRLFGGNPATRSLMKRTKWYAGLLDNLGIVDFEQPEEIVNRIPNLDQKIEEYNQTPEALDNFMSDFGGVNPSNINMDGENSLVPDKIKGVDPLSMILNSLIPV